VIFDTFMFNNELDMLECRLYELENIPNLVHVAVEADVDHQDHPKPYHLSENLDRFEPWKDRLVVVRATGPPDRAETRTRGRASTPNASGPARDGPTPSDSDVVLHGDSTRSRPRSSSATSAPRGFVAFDMRLLLDGGRLAAPDRWRGTVAGRPGTSARFGDARRPQHRARRSRTPDGISAGSAARRPS
jgi:hypothetical protein